MLAHVALQHDLPLLIDGPLRKRDDLTSAALTVVTQNAYRVINLISSDIHPSPEDLVIVLHNDSKVRQRTVLNVFFVDHGVNHDGTGLEDCALANEDYIKELSWLSLLH